MQSRPYIAVQLSIRCSNMNAEYALLHTYNEIELNWIESNVVRIRIFVQNFQFCWGQTSLNVIRLLDMLPKISSPTFDSCAAINMSVSTFRILRGSKYHFSWLISVVISSNFAPTFSPNSQTPYTVMNRPNNSLHIDTISIAFSLIPCSYSCGRRENGTSFSAFISAWSITIFNLSISKSLHIPTIMYGNSINNVTSNNFDKSPANLQNENECDLDCFTWKSNT